MENKKHYTAQDVADMMYSFGIYRDALEQYRMEPAKWSESTLLRDAEFVSKFIPKEVLSTAPRFGSTIPLESRISLSISRTEFCKKYGTRAIITQQ